MKHKEKNNVGLDEKDKANTMQKSGPNETQTPIDLWAHHKGDQIEKILDPCHN